MLGQDVDELAKSGPQLIFVAYPQALATMTPQWLWSILFFLTLFVLGINTIIIDFAISYNRKIRRELVAGVVCLAVFALATPNQGSAFGRPDPTRFFSSRIGMSPIFSSSTYSECVIPIPTRSGPGQPD